MYETGDRVWGDRGDQETKEMEGSDRERGRDRVGREEQVQTCRDPVMGKRREERKAMGGKRWRRRDGGRGRRKREELKSPEGPTS